MNMRGLEGACIRDKGIVLCLHSGMHEHAPRLSITVSSAAPPYNTTSTAVKDGSHTNRVEKCMAQTTPFSTKFMETLQKEES